MFYCKLYNDGFSLKLILPSTKFYWRSLTPVTARSSGRSPHAWRVCPSPLKWLQRRETTDRGEYNDQQAVVRNSGLVLINPISTYAPAYIRCRIQDLFTRSATGDVSPQRHAASPSTFPSFPNFPCLSVSLINCASSSNTNPFHGEMLLLP